MNRNRKLGNTGLHEFQERKRKAREFFFALLKAFVKDYNLTIKDIEALLAVFAKLYVEQERQRTETLVREIIKKVEKWPDWMLCERAKAPTSTPEHKRKKNIA